MTEQARVSKGTSVYRTSLPAAWETANGEDAGNGHPFQILRVTKRIDYNKEGPDYSEYALQSPETPLYEFSCVLVRGYNTIGTKQAEEVLFKRNVFLCELPPDILAIFEGTDGYNWVPMK